MSAADPEGKDPEGTRETLLYLRHLSTLSLAAGTILESALQTADPDGLTPVLNNIRSATGESVNRFIRNSFKPDQSSLVVAGDTVAIKAVRKAITAPPPAVSRN